LEVLLSKFGLPVRSMTSIDASHCLDLMRLDKKNKDGELRMALPKRIGSVVYDVKVPEALALEGLGHLATSHPERA
jgi:3-dehydroquinate synthetase